MPPTDPSDVSPLTGLLRPELARTPHAESKILTTAFFGALGVNLASVALLGYAQFLTPPLLPAKQEAKKPPLSVGIYRIPRPVPPPPSLSAQPGIRPGSGRLVSINASETTNSAGARQAAVPPLSASHTAKTVAAALPATGSASHDKASPPQTAADAAVIGTKSQSPSANSPVGKEKNSGAHSVPIGSVAAAPVAKTDNSLAAVNAAPAVANASKTADGNPTGRSNQKTEQRPAATVRMTAEAKSSGKLSDKGGTAALPSDAHGSQMVTELGMATRDGDTGEAAPAAKNDEKGKGRYVVPKVAKMWAIAPGQKLVLPDGMKMELPADLPVVPGSAFLTEDQLAQLRKLLLSQNLRQMKGLTKEQLKKMLATRKEAEHPHASVAALAGAAQPTAKKTETAAKARPKTETKPRGAREAQVALAPPGMTSPFRYRTWNPVWHERYAPNVRDTDSLQATTGERRRGDAPTLSTAAPTRPNTHAPKGKGTVGLQSKQVTSATTDNGSTAAPSGSNAQSTPLIANTNPGGAAGSGPSDKTIAAGAGSGAADAGQGKAGNGGEKTAGTGGVGQANGKGSNASSAPGSGQNAAGQAGDSGEGRGKGAGQTTAANGNGGHVSGVAGNGNNPNRMGGGAPGKPGKGNGQTGISGTAAGGRAAGQNGAGTAGNGGAPSGASPSGKGNGKGTGGNSGGFLGGGAGGQSGSGAAAGEGGEGNNPLLGSANGGAGQNGGKPGAGAGQAGGGQNGTAAGGGQNGTAAGGGGGAAGGGAGSGSGAGQGNGGGTAAGGAGSGAGGVGGGAGSGGGGGVGGSGMLAGVDFGPGTEPEGIAGEVAESGDANGIDTGSVPAVGVSPNYPDHNAERQNGLPGALVLPPLPPQGTETGKLNEPRLVKLARRAAPATPLKTERRTRPQTARTAMMARIASARARKPLVTVVGSASRRGSVPVTLVARGSGKSAVNGHGQLATRPDNDDPLAPVRDEAARASEAQPDALSAPLPARGAKEKRIVNSRGVRSGTKNPLPPTPLPDSDAELGDGSGLKGEYYLGRNFEQFQFTRADKNLDLFWGGDRSPSPRLPIGADWSCRWWGRVQPRYSGVYTLYAVADDGVRVWVNHKLLIDDWTLHPLLEYSGQVRLEAGKQYDIRVDYFESGGPPASIGVYWESDKQQKEFLPEACLFYPLPGEKMKMEQYEKPRR